ncbi:hypothetical protein ACE1MS_22825 (plasmid) [Lysinibacillus sp. fkY74-1]
MKNKITYITGDEYSKIIKGESDVNSIFRKAGIEWVGIEELQDITNKSMMTYFISKLNVVNLLNPEEYGKLNDIDLSTRTGSNIKVVTQVGNYRFQDNLILDISSGEMCRRYFLLDFNKVDSKDRASKIYELDLYSFYLLISEICSAKQDIENDIENEEAKTYLTHMENVITEFIKNYHNLCRMKEIIKK